MNVHRRLLFPWLLATLLLAPALGAGPETAPVGKMTSAEPRVASTRLEPEQAQGPKKSKKNKGKKAELSKRFKGNGNGTAKDSQTGLLWTTNDHGADVDWNNAAQYCADLELGGRANWRLPTIEELEELYVQDLSSDCGGSTCHVYPPFELSSCCPWSSTKTGSSSAFVVSFDIGERTSNSLAFANGTRALCVTAGEDAPEAAPEASLTGGVPGVASARLEPEQAQGPNKSKKSKRKSKGKRKKTEEELLREELSKRFKRSGKGTARDTQTGLLWTTNDRGTDVDWNNAEQYCADLELGRRGNWRLPTIEELEELYVEELSSDCGGWTCHVYPPFELSSCCPWSSTKSGGSSAFALYFDIGERNSNGLAFANGTRVLCVTDSN
ncbi:MAG: DUF1566 domain-containing protein [Acidobacteria bacterium]|nr:MAG: DUF1566 domain-containing protein [Acidobacteriota bacterium]